MGYGPRVNPSADPNNSSSPHHSPNNIQSMLTSINYGLSNTFSRSALSLSLIIPSSIFDHAYQKAQTPLQHPTSQDPKYPFPIFPHNPHSHPHTPHPTQAALSRSRNPQRTSYDLYSRSNSSCRWSANLPASEHNRTIDRSRGRLVKGARRLALSVHSTSIRISH